MLKRLFDLLAALSITFLFSPILLIISLIIYLIDGSPIFFLQKRVGRNNKTFFIFKFRTMEVLQSAEAGRFDAGDQSRITPLGFFLRKTKLDELPQFINVIKGDMSIVGPRPEVRKWVLVYPEKWAKIHEVRPGITDPASIEYRNEEEILLSSPDPEVTYKNFVLPHKLALYESYVENQSFINDLIIIFRTIRALLK